MALSSFLAEEMERENLNWLELPKDITQNILQRLDTIEIVTSVSQVCPLWWNICKDPLMWRTIQMIIKGRNSPYDLAKICHYAIQRSCGQLEDISIHRFGTDDLLKSIALNGSHLRCMRLVECNGISDKGFIEAAKQFPRLEELEIKYVEKLSKDSLEVIGQSCPLLKSLKFTRQCEEYYYDGEAFAIAKTMPKLSHLSINGNVLTGVGLLAILNGCPFLESLDLRDCFHLEFTDNDPLEKRCKEQIKYLYLPYDDIVDCLPYDDLADSLSENLNDDFNSEYGYDYEVDDF